MVDRIDYRFFYGRVREIPYTGRFSAIRMFQDSLVQIIAFNVAQGLAGNSCQGALEYLFIEVISTRAIRELDNVDLRVWKEPVWLLAKEHQADVLGPRTLARAVHHVHLAPQFFD